MSLNAGTKHWIVDINDRFKDFSMSHHHAEDLLVLNFAFNFDIGSLLTSLIIVGAIAPCGETLKISAAVIFFTQ